MINVLYLSEGGSELEYNCVFLLPSPLALPSVTLLRVRSILRGLGTRQYQYRFLTCYDKKSETFFARMKVFKICFSITSILVRPGL